MDATIYIKSTMLYMIPLLYFIGIFIKLGTDKIPNRWIPFILLGVSLIICYFTLNFSYESTVQAILIAGMSVYTNELLNKFVDIDKFKKEK